MQTISLADFQNRCVALLKQVVDAGESLLIIEDSCPLARIVPCAPNATEQYTQELLAILRGNVIRYDAPEEPVGESDWSTLQC